MNWELIFTSALISGIISSIFALYGNERIKKVEFRFNYKKYVLDKRIAAYEKIETIINSFYAGFDNEVRFKLMTNPTTNDRSELIEFQKRIRLVIAKNIWINDETLNKLSDINSVIGEMIEDIDTGKTNHNDPGKIGPRAYVYFTKHFELASAYFNDIKTLDQIEPFAKSKTKNLGSIVKGVSKELEILKPKE